MARPNLGIKRSKGRLWTTEKLLTLVSTCLHSYIRPPPGLVRGAANRQLTKARRAIRQSETLRWSSPATGHPSAKPTATSRTKAAALTPAARTTITTTSSRYRNCYCFCCNLLLLPLLCMKFEAHVWRRLAWQSIQFSRKHTSGTSGVVSSFDPD